MIKSPAKNKFADRLKPLLSPTELALIKKLSTPTKVQNFLDSFPVNFSKIGESVQSPAQVLKNKRAHCIEGAILAAAALGLNGRPGWLLDLRAGNDDEDHVVALFKENGLWGAISKTNHPQLRWRDPIYKSVRELAMSYVNEYFLWDITHNKVKVSKNKKGKKTLREYSKPFDITKFDPSLWWNATDLDWLAEKLDDSPHLPLFPKSAIKNLRKASSVEIEAAKLIDWKKAM
jgi:hypothetical protein